MPFERTQFKVLVADDDSLSRQIVGTVLRQNNIIDILSVGNGQIAMNAIYAAQKLRSPFHIVFLDWEMPLVSGFEVLSHFRKLKPFDNTAFVILTSVSEGPAVLRAVKAGANGYILKPVSHDRVHEGLRNVCAWVRKRQS
jgi:two-component system chemotaxis response regulator CheY